MYGKTELTEEQLQSVNINWESRRATRIESNQEQARQEPVKKGKAQTIFNSVAELGRKLIPSKRKGGK